MGLNKAPSGGEVDTRPDRGGSQIFAKKSSHPIGAAGDSSRLLAGTSRSSGGLRSIRAKVMGATAGLEPATILPVNSNCRGSYVEARKLYPLSYVAKTDVSACWQPTLQA